MKLGYATKDEMSAALGVGKLIHVGKRRRVEGRLVNGYVWDLASPSGASDILRERGQEWSIELFDATPPGACPKMPLPAKPGAGEVLWLATSRTRRMTTIAFHGPGLALAKCLAEMAVIGADLAPSAPGSAKATRI